MKRIAAILSPLLITILLIAAAPANAGDQRRHDEDFAADGLGGTIERYLSEKEISTRTITIGWRDIESGEEQYLGADVFMEEASTYKLPLCMHFMRLWLNGIFASMRTDIFTTVTASGCSAAL